MSEYNFQLQRLLYRNGFDHRAAFIVMCKGDFVDAVLVIGLVALVSGMSTVAKVCLELSAPFVK